MLCFMNLNLCLPEGCLVNVSLCLYVSVCFMCLCIKTRGFFSEFLEQYRKHHMGEGIGYFMEIFSRVLQGIMSLQLTRQHCY